MTMSHSFQSQIKIYPFNPFIYRAMLALLSLNSKVYKRPCGAIARAIQVDKDPLPVPDSTTMNPGFNSSLAVIIHASVA